MKPSGQNLSIIFERFHRHQALDVFLAELAGHDSVAVANLPGVALCLLATATATAFNAPVVIIGDNSQKAERLFDDFQLFAENHPVGFFPEAEHQVQSPLFSDPNSFVEFFSNQALRLLADSPNPIITTALQALKRPLPPKLHWQTLNIVLGIDSVIDRNSFLANLASLGYIRAEQVENRLDYCVKGGIIDLFPPNAVLPIRIELDGDRVASLRLFNPDTQLSVEKIDSLTIAPPAGYIDQNVAPVTLQDYLPPNIIFLSLVVAEALDDSWLPQFLRVNDSAKLVTVDNFSPNPIDFHASAISFNSIKDFRLHLPRLPATCPDGRAFVFCSSEAQIDRLGALLGDLSLINFVLGRISESVEFPDIGLYLYSEHDIFHREQPPAPFRKLLPDLPVQSFNLSDIAPGDYMVHIDYGIGRFLRLDKISAFGAQRECLVLEYADRDKVYVPLEKIHLVHKYRGTEGFVPQLNRLGSTDWEKTKLRTRRTVYHLSEELINLYAQRLHTSRPPYQPDTELQLQLESSFWFEETTDQIRATEDIKKDLEESQPMDRLLCGDVGFGKTEVAIRAAFKVVSSSKQVAVLAPTTILADQHYMVFTRRLQDFPVRIALLTRFVPQKLQRQILPELAAGKIDIVIGTHRLLSKDLAFKDLGLLIIDEEHRFGVKAKEQLKLLRTQLDVLSLSATPIPRSLYLSLIGARDLSIIQTPPKSRMPISTEVIHFDQNIIRDAVRREIDRGGQVYFVHNEVATIARFTQKLCLLFPDLPIAFAHGQMREHDLETIMRGFINGDISILVTTTIIESGIDIPNANTIFINNAHRFGLAQLYQLRGRVGRSNRRAFAYLIVPSISQLKPEAILKLKAISRYTSLGSGYQLAMHDLEIRGMGNVLGVEQSGNIQAIGYDLYLKILREAFEKLKSGAASPADFQGKTEFAGAEIIYPFAAYLPEDYIRLGAVRLNYYRRLGEAQNLDELTQIEAELVDIYGKLPPEGRGLLELHHLRILANSLSIQKIILRRDTQIYWQNNWERIVPEQLIAKVKNIASINHWSYKFISDNNFGLVVYFATSTPFADQLKLFLKSLSGSVNL